MHRRRKELKAVWEWGLNPEEKNSTFYVTCIFQKAKQDKKGVFQSQKSYFTGKGGGQPVLLKLS
jgi:hypothetical protein